MSATPADAALVIAEAEAIIAAAAPGSLTRGRLYGDLRWQGNRLRFCLLHGFMAEDHPNPSGLLVPVDPLFYEFCAIDKANPRLPKLVDRTSAGFCYHAGRRLALDAESAGKLYVAPAEKPKWLAKGAA